MITFADCKKAEKGTCFIFVDGGVPEGYFGVSVVSRRKVERVYLFEGEQADLNAVLRGHINYDVKNGETVRYAYAISEEECGGGYLGQVENNAEAFAKTVEFHS